jgi:hypothetical protein
MDIFIMGLFYIILMICMIDGMVQW